MKKLLVLFLTISASISFAQESVLLRLNYEKGATYGVTMEMNQEMGTVMAMGMNMNMDVKIIDVQESTYNSEMRITKISMDMLQGGNAVSFDSSKSDEELSEAGRMMKNQMAPMLKAVIFAKGNNLGKIEEMKMEPNVAGMEDMVKRSSNVVYPKEPVKVGGSWEIKREVNGMNMNLSYMIKSVIVDKILVDISGDVSGMATGKISGNLEIEKDSGIPLISDLVMDMEINAQKLKTKVIMKTAKK